MILESSEIKKRLKEIKELYTNKNITINEYFDTLKTIISDWAPYSEEVLEKTWSPTSEPFLPCNTLSDNINAINDNDFNTIKGCDFLKEMYITDIRTRARRCFIRLLSERCEDTFKEIMNDIVIPKENDNNIMLYSIEKLREITQSEKERFLNFRDTDDMINADNRMGKRFWMKKYSDYYTGHKLHKERFLKDQQ